MLSDRIRIAYRKLKGFLVFGKVQPSLRQLPNIRGKLYLNKFGELHVGKKLNIIGKPWGTQLTVVKGAKLVIGDHVSINSGVGIAANVHISIGNNVMIGPRTSIMDSAYHLIDSLDDGSNTARKIVIEDNAWIGTGSLVLPGVTIGKNSVVAAGSTVTKDVPANTLVAGSPAKVIRELTIHEGWVRT